jgi:BirA family transcriptional regulator, biotin operon repressor / biotin---[acetyl-CoA-carboxylase] ligase
VEESASNSFDLPALDSALADTPFAGRLHFFPEIASTNTHAMRAGEAGAEHGSVYFADEQTAGRGRGAHAWSSPPGTGLYVSTLLRPPMAPGDALWISLAAGLAVQQAVAEVTALRADLRWPNDLLLGAKKFCGILTEMNAEATRVRHLVVGIGINVLQPAFPEGLDAIATSLRIETGQHWSRQELLLALLRALHQEIEALTDPATAMGTRASILTRLEAGSTWIRGKRVRVEEGAGYTGVTEGLDERGFLRVRTPEGVRTVFSGGVREDK